MGSTLKRILVIGPSNIGDAILASEVVAAVHRRFPEAHLTLVVGERAQALFDRDPRVGQLINTDRYDSAAGRLKLALSLWRLRPQLLIDLRHTVYPLLLKPLSSWRYVRQPPKTIKHMRDRHLWKLRAQVPQAAAGEPVVEEPSFWWSDSDTAQVDQLWRRWRLDGRSRVVVICPGARTHIKRWVSEGFAALADRLIAEARVQVIFSGEPVEGPVVHEILASMREKAYSAVGLTTIRQLGVLMRRAQLVIANDSAALHVASAVQVPTVAIFGPTDEDKYGPTSARHRTIRRRLFCTPCEQSLCRFSHECMRFIGAEEVYNAAKQLLGPGKRCKR